MRIRMLVEEDRFFAVKGAWEKKKNGCAGS